MRTAEISVEIEKPATDVYNHVVDSDHITTWATKDDSLVHGLDGPIEVGSTFSEESPGNETDRRRFIYEIVALEPGDMVAIKTAGRLLTYTARRTFNGSTAVTVVKEVIEMEDPPGLARLLGGFMMGRIKRTHQKSLQELKTSLEGSA